MKDVLLALNAGSTSIKFSLFEIASGSPDLSLLYRGEVRAIASKSGGGKIRSKNGYGETWNNSAHWTWQAILPK